MSLGQEPVFTGKIYEKGKIPENTVDELIDITLGEMHKLNPARFFGKFKFSITRASLHDKIMKESLIFVVKDNANKKIAGFLFVDKENADVSYVHSLFVREEYRKKGIATFIVEALKHFTPEDHNVYFHFDGGNKILSDFYENKGAKIKPNPAFLEKKRMMGYGKKEKLV